VNSSLHSTKSTVLLERTDPQLHFKPSQSRYLVPVRLTAPGLIALGLMILSVACTKQDFGNLESGVLTESVALGDVTADNEASNDAFGSDGSGAHVLIRNFYDGNRNGHFDPDEALLPGWGFRITHVNAENKTLEASEVLITPTTNGKRWQGAFWNVPVGRYTIGQLAPKASASRLSWNTTRAASVSLNLTKSSAVQVLEFASVCLENNMVVPFSSNAWKCEPKFDLAPRIASFTVTPNEAQAGDRPTFAWEVLDNSALEIDEGVGALPTLRGAKDVLVTDATRYTLTAKNAFDSSSAQVTLRAKPNALTGTFTQISSSITEPFAERTSVVLENGNVLFRAQTRPNDGPVQAQYLGLDLYDPAANTFTSLGKIAGFETLDSLTGAIPIGGGKLFHRVPVNQGDPIQSVKYEVFDFETGEGITLKGPQSASQVATWDKQMINILSCTSSTGYEFELYDPKTDTSSFTTCIDIDLQSSLRSVWTPLSSSKILLTGGFRTGIRPPDQADTPVFATAYAAILDLSNGTFRRIADMGISRFGHNATRLENGQVLITGGIAGHVGRGAYPAIAASETFDPITERFAPAGDMLVGLYSPQTFVLPNQKVLFIGGNQNAEHNFSGSCPALIRPQLFDPATRQFSYTSNYLEPRSLPLNLQFKDGRVLVMNGCTPVPNLNYSISSIEIYNP
jgi:hypothetical protein